MGATALTGKDTITLGTRILNDLADGDVANLEYPDNLVEGKNGKNGNVIYSFNAMGQRSTLTLRVLIGSADDKFLNSAVSNYINDPAGFTLLEGEFIKRVGDGAGNITNVVYLMAGGIVQKIPGSKENVAGETDQGVSIYVILFANTPRTLA
jgi:hypothetical protein